MMMLVKNGIRIATLTLLANYVDVDFLTGNYIIVVESFSFDWPTDTHASVLAVTTGEPWVPKLAQPLARLITVTNSRSCFRVVRVLVAGFFAVSFTGISTSNIRRTRRSSRRDSIPRREFAFSKF